MLGRPSGPLRLEKGNHTPPPFERNSDVVLERVPYITEELGLFRTFDDREWVHPTARPCAICSAGVKDPLSKQIEVAATVHCSFDDLQSIHLPFSLAITMLHAECCSHRRCVSPQSQRESF